ncbi:hypothetical protein BDV98DRAFT_608967 [Pterulicium gracile]|uniref:Uncharacterized protein n=1 Tax=Pterulicium gracile TaxID=1884261 RepID=A0A5C3Q0R2_9AGAR|nr:hypothetical protein BDV98DRAFT_608967 [Pterula gracilis]
MSRSVPNPVASIFLARMTRNIVAMVRFRSFGDTRDNIDCREQRVQSSGNLDNRPISLGGGDQRSKVGGARIIVLLAESGLVYAVLQIIRLALNVSIIESTPFYGSLDTEYPIFQSASLVVTVSLPPFDELFVAMYPPTLCTVFLMYGPNVLLYSPVRVYRSVTYFAGRTLEKYVPPALIIIIGYGYSIADTIQMNTISGLPGSSSEPRPRRRGPVHTLSDIVFNRSRGRSTTHSSGPEMGEFEGTGVSKG